jgi:hypothetical protein
MKIPSLSKQKPFQPTVRHHAVLKHAKDSAPIPRFWIVPRIEIPMLAVATFGVLFLLVLLYFFALERNPILGTINTILFWVTVGIVATAGDNGRRLRHWFGYWSLHLRTPVIPADQRPVSRKVTRLVFYSLMGLDLGILIWWWVYTRAPLPERSLYPDRLLWEEAKLEHLGTQLAMFWWLLPVLALLWSGFLIFLEERVPVIGWNLKRTKLVNILAPVIAFFLTKMILRWIEQNTGWSLF